MKRNISNSFLDVVSHSRLYLAIVIVMMHCIGPEIKGFFPVIAFYFISGYFFFYNYNEKRNVVLFFREKMVKRFFSLVIPYFFWNIIYALVLYLIDNKDFECTTNSGLFFSCFWSSSNSSVPINGPLWFMRNLFFYILVTPLIFFVIKVMRSFSLFFFLFFLVLVMSIDMPLFLDVYLGVFSIGAYLGFYKIDLTKHMYKSFVFIIVLVMTILFYILSFKMTNSNTQLYHFFYCIFASLLVFSFIRILLKKSISCSPNSIRGSSMYIYVSHMVFYICVFPVMHAINLKHGTRLIATPIVLLLCIGSYYVMCKYIPSLMNLLMGDMKQYENLFCRIVKK